MSQDTAASETTTTTPKVEAVANPRRIRHSADAIQVKDEKTTA